MKTAVIHAHRRRNLLSLGLALMILCLSVMGVSADTTPVLVEGASPSGLIAGNTTTGGFAGYTIQYPEGRPEMVLTLEIGPVDPVYADVVGMKLYGPYEFTSTGAIQEDGTYEISYRADDAAELYVQVYNYGRFTVPYTLSVEGIAESDEVVAVAEVAVAAETVDMPALGSVSGSLVGNTGGAYANYPMTCADLETDICIEMTYAPNDPSLTPAFGLNIWDPSGELVSRGVQPGTDDGQAKLWATFKPEAAGEYTVQVFNYSDGALMSYTLTTTYPDPA